MVLIYEERMTIRANLQNARRHEKLTQCDMARTLGISENHYQAIELGRQLGSIKVWDALEDLFNIPQRQLRETTSPEN